jgi:hypothetical protein
MQLFGRLWVERVVAALPASAPPVCTLRRLQLHGGTIHRHDPVRPVWMAPCMHGDWPIGFDTLPSLGVAGSL